MQKNLRYLILLLILLAIAVHEAVIKVRTTSWDQTLDVRIYAANGDRLAATERYIGALRTPHFEPIEDFVNREARRYGIGINAIEIGYGGQLDTVPPQPPSGHNILHNIWWSLRIRAWSLVRRWRSDDQSGDIELYVVYHDTATTQSLGHSVGLRGGMLGFVNAFADRDYSGSNQVVIVHELLHTLGATDKYGADNRPLFPQGYAEPERQPLHPQRLAEIMGGRIPLSPFDLRMPESLDEVTVGLPTAAEIHWPIELRHPGDAISGAVNVLPVER